MKIITGLSKNSNQQGLTRNNDKDEDLFDDKENIVELPNEVVQAFYEKMTPEKQNRDLALSPQTDKKSLTEGKFRENKDRKLKSMERLYMSPSPFHSPDDLRP